MSPRGLLSRLPSTDMLLAGAVIGIMAVMIVPLPAVVLDLLLTFNLTFSILILMVSMFILRPLEFSVFPSLLLMITLFRLSLNLASTRLVLLYGNEGTAAAGRVIEAFGQFVVGGNYVVGAVVFLILVVIQFVVITKGAGRIAEVAARFTLDAMPGKQMAIDADLNAGLINDQDARRRRREIAQEADFYGAMDGASKFVRGDAVAGILITGINILGGLAVGIFQQGMNATDALQTYTILTIGDGLVTQVPALIVSTAAGLVITRAAAESDLSKDLVGQLTVQPRAMGMAALVLLVLALVPGMPTFPFLLLASAAGSGAYFLDKRQTKVHAAVQEKPHPPTPEKVESLLPIDPLELEVGYGLIPLVDPGKGGDLLERIRMIRRQFALELGFVVPPVRIRDNLQLRANQYVVKLRGSEVGTGEVYADRFLAMDPGTAQEQLEGIETREPTFGLPALWISGRQKERAQAAGYTVVDPGTVVATHLSEVVRSQAMELLGRQDVQGLIDQVKATHPAVVEGLIPNVLPLGAVHKVLQNLLAEAVSIRDLTTILETLADYGHATKDPVALTEYVRSALAKVVVKPFLSPDGSLKPFVLSPGSEQIIAESLADGGNVVMDPRVAQRLIEAVAGTVERSHPLDSKPVLVVSAHLRWPLRRLLERPFPHLGVLSYSEIPSSLNVHAIGSIDMVGEPNETPLIGARR
ncbi:MAG TPA: flagellar biosynthesis protein FlhA, partial [Methylomirabilota bacterium]|nr:flagellar biosynthesis protein FlhA [Methylomirabilota bacterium]